MAEGLRTVVGIIGDLIGNLESRDWIAFGAVIVSFISLVITLRDKKRQQHEAIIRALQGQKEAVAYIGLRMRHRRLPWSRKNRHEIITALCLAWILESSDRARSSLLPALREAYKVRPDEVEETRQDICKQLTEYLERIDLDPKSQKDVKGYREELRQLGEALRQDDKQRGEQPLSTRLEAERPH